MYKIKIKSAINYFYTFIKWIFISAVVGSIGGSVGTLFHKCVEYATGFRLQNNWLVWLLPVGGIIITALYKACKLHGNTGTNQIIDSIRSDKKVPFVMAPLIFISTVITHLLGGSAGREGAALQLGGSIGYRVGNLFRLDEKDMHLITLCGMSSVFSALFGTPITATVFAMEVVSVGIIYYSGFIPCIISSLTAYQVSLLFGIQPVRFSLGTIPDPSLTVIIKTIILAILCAVISIIFCVALHKTHMLLDKVWKNDYIRIVIGGFTIIILTFLVKTGDYNGAGMDIITRAIGGNAKPEAFILKIVFTAITIGAGYKGGEIVPTFFIGATFGCLIGNLIGLDPCFSAAVGMTALFCGVVNCPISSIFLSVEIFGSQGLILFVIACGVTNMLSGNYSLYSSQKLIYSKLKAEYINIYAE